MSSAAERLKSHGIALTGGVATGKSYVAQLLRARAYLVIDADQLARLIVEPGRPALQAIIERWSPQLLGPTGHLDRRQLRTLIVQDPQARLQLESITHPYIQAELLHTIEAAGLVNKPQWFFYEAALIFETQRHPHFHAVWATYAEPETQVQRLMQRDGLTRVAAQALIASQMPAQEKAQRADIMLHTDRGDAHLQAELDKALNSLS